MLYSINKSKPNLHSKKPKQIIKDIDTLPYHTIHMGGNFQKEFTHEIPKEKKKLGIRYSFTFRKHKK